MTREIRPITGDGTGEGVREGDGPERTRQKTNTKQSKNKGTTSRGHVVERGGGER